MAFARPRRAELPSPARSPRLAILRPDRDLLRLLDEDLTKERSYSQPCREWPEVKSHLAIVLAPSGRQSDELDREQQERIWGLGIARPAHETDVDRKVFVTHARRVRGLVPVSALLGAGGKRDAALAESLPESGPVTVGADIVLGNLRQISPDVVAAVQELTLLLDEDEGWSNQELRWRDERDALLLFAKMAGLAQKDFTRTYRWDRAAVGASYISGLTGAAVQPMFDDVHGRAAERFSGTCDTVVRALVGRENGQGYDLEATSVINPWVVDGEEGSLDAYYYHADTGTLVILRYLRLGSNGFFSPDILRSLDQFHNQAHRLTKSARRSVDDYGLLEDPLFLRIHGDVPFTPALHRTSSGAIYPYGQVAAAITAAVTPGFPGSPADLLTRHLVPTDFARLVRDGWFGARGVSFDLAMNCVNATVDSVGAALVVVDFSRRPRSNGSGLGARV
ncbi:hypothetical protein ACH4ZX_05710 [Streptomyces sp. NPDC020490]|uniref:hypothetical protein n=1 Tax=Streptomyces sp. NPDC020490 TaxID=3365078 RepID=UPI0037A4B439